MGQDEPERPLTYASAGLLANSSEPPDAFLDSRSWLLVKPAVVNFIDSFSIELARVMAHPECDGAQRHRAIGWVTATNMAPKRPSGHEM